jgi:heme exporter protein A
MGNLRYSRRMPSALAVEHLSKWFGSTLALDDVAWTVEPGAAIALFGPNGAGKTTLMRVCATLLRPSHGTVLVLGLDTATQGAAVRRRIAVLGHEPWLYPDLSARENLRFYARLFGLGRQTARIDALVEQLGLGGWSHRPVRALSRGLLQRAALARVLLHEPDVLFLDEPFSGLDLEARDVLCDVLRNVHRRGATLVMSTHEVGVGLSLCTSAVVLVRGRIAWQGPTGSADVAEFETRYRRLTHRDDQLMPSLAAGS